LQKEEREVRGRRVDLYMETRDWILLEGSRGKEGEQKDWEGRKTKGLKREENKRFEKVRG
jgi:hypothetical protein